MKFYADKFKKIRQLKRIAVNDVANSININRTTLWAWENGKRIPSEGNVRALAKELDISVKEISDLPPLNATIQGFSKPVRSLLEIADIDSSARDQTVKIFKKQLDILDEKLNNATTIIQGLLSSIDVAFYIKAQDLKFIIANNSFLEILNIKDNAGIIGKKDETILPWKEAAINSKQDHEVLNTGVPIINLESYIPGTRKRKHGLISKIPILDKNNKVIGITGIFKDITEHIHTKNNLFNKKLELEQHIKELNCLYRISLTLKKKHLTLNETYQKIVDIIPSGFLSENSVNVQLIINNRPFTTANFTTTDYSISSPIFINDKSVGKLEVYFFKEFLDKHLLKYNTRGKFLINTIVNSIIEITESGLIEEEKITLSNAIKTSAFAMCINDFEYNFTYANPAYEKMFGYSYKELRKKQITDLIPEKLRNKFNEEILPQLKAKGKWVGENLGLRRDGTVFPIFVSSSVISNKQGVPFAICATFYDITAQKEAKNNLLSEQNKLNILMNAVDGGITILDKKYNILYQNKLAIERFRESKGKKCYSAYWNKEDVCNDCIVKKAFDTKKSFSQSERRTMPDGKIVSFKKIVTPIKDKDNKVNSCFVQVVYSKDHEEK